MARVMSAAFLVAAVLVITRYLPGWVFLAMIGLLSVLGVWELGRLASRRGFSLQTWSGAAGAGLLVYAFHDTRIGLPGALASVIVSLSVLSLLRADRPETKFVNLALTIFAALFFGLLLGHMVALRGLPGEDGHDLPFLLLFIVASADTGAFYGGRALGRHPLAPLLSPNKTIEGLATGVLCGMGAALVARAWFIHRLDLVDCVVLGILLAVIGAVGDLVESMIKRWAGAKNSSELIPGHGGILDRIDALLFAAPILFYYHHQFMEGPIG